MNFFKKILPKEVRGKFEALLFGQFVKTDKAMNLPAVYRCVDVLASAVAQLPIGACERDSRRRNRWIEDNITDKINDSISPRYTRYQLMYQLVTSMYLNGNGYALIERDNNLKFKALIWVHPDDVTVTVRNGDIYYQYKGRTYEQDDFIHILNYSYDGIEGISTLSHAVNTIELSDYSEQHAKNFFKGGGNLSGFLKVDGIITDKQKEELKKSWRSSLDPTSGVSNGIAVLPGNIDFKPITVSPVEAQMLETRKFNVIDICRFFGVSPIKAFDLSAANYSTVEATNLDFLTGTLQPLLTKIEQELTRKLLLPSERRKKRLQFDTDLLLRADKKTQAEFASKLVGYGIMTPNEGREMFDLGPVKNGDVLFVPVNLQPIDKSINTNNDIDGEGDKISDGDTA
jgi:phage portal protein, HK97 family